MYEVLYFIFLSLVFGIGVILIQSYFLTKVYVKFRWRPRNVLKKLISALKDPNQDEIFRQAGIPISIAQYSAFRNLLLLLVSGYIIIRFLRHGVKAVVLPTVFLFVLYVVSNPVLHKRNGKPTLFKKLILKLQQTHYDACNIELMRVVTQLKNIAVSQTQVSWSADYIIEILMRVTRLTKPIFAQTLSLMRLAKMEDAAQYFSNNFGTKMGEDFAAILVKLDKLDPSDFLIQINGFQTNIKESKYTIQKQKQEAAGRRIFILASVLLSIILFNFMFIMFQNLMIQLTF